MVKLLKIVTSALLAHSIALPFEHFEEAHCHMREVKW